jgi:formiminoglutamase
MQLTDYLSPVSESVFQQIQESSPRSLINVTDIFSRNMPDLEGVHLAIIGVMEDRVKSMDEGCAAGPDQLRKQFYQLVKHKYDIRLADLGNIKQGDSVDDTLFAMNSCVRFLLEQKIVPIILGGSQDLAYAQYTAYQGFQHSVNMVTCDAGIDLKQNETTPQFSNYLYKIIAHQPNYLFNLVHLGNQNYFIEQESLDAFEKMNFDLMRLGNVRTKLQETEPLLRNADIFVFSLNSVRAGDAPGSVQGNPNGLFAEEACQLMRYAGMGSDLTSVGLYDLNSLKDQDERTAKLGAQMLWYFIDGFYNRRNDYPVPDSHDYMIYRTTFKSSNYEIIFYKHLNSERWWMEVPYPNEKSKHKGMFMVPCSYSDYQAAQNDEIPDRWMKAYHKLM